MIFEMLETGKDNARSAKELAQALNVELRAISSMVEQERRAGKAICATSNSKTPGYYIAETRHDMEDYCERLRHRAGEIFKTRAACLKSLDSLPAEAAHPPA